MDHMEDNYVKLVAVRLILLPQKCSLKYLVVALLMIEDARCFPIFFRKTYPPHLLYRAKQLSAVIFSFPFVRWRYLSHDAQSNTIYARQRLTE